MFSLASNNKNNVYEMVNGMMELKTSSAQNLRMNIWEEVQSKLIKLSLRSTIISQYMSGGQAVIARLKEISCTGICATLVIGNELSFGEMMTVGYIIGRLSGPFQRVISMIGQIQDANISYERLEEVLESEPEIQGTIDYKNQEIYFKNVGFKYPGASSPYIIKNLNLHIPSGKTTAIVGESGCGKTTLIKLMLGFYIPQEGEIFLSGANLRALNRDKWLEHCGAVMQSGFIFSDSISNNITLGSASIDKFKIQEVAEIVGLHEFISSLPMGYNTKVGQTGLELSGGQKQRLLIARAIYKNPDILILDESTSSLDAYNEHRITDAILNLQKGKTLIIAAHRLSTVRNTDLILYMERGEIIEKGSHQELLNLRGRYYSLISNQL